MLKIKNPSKKNALRIRVGMYIRDRIRMMEIDDDDFLDATGYSEENMAYILSGYRAIPKLRIKRFARILEVEENEFVRFVSGRVKNCRQYYLKPNCESQPGTIINQAHSLSYNATEMASGVTDRIWAVKELRTTTVPPRLNNT